MSLNDDWRFFLLNGYFFSATATTPNVFMWKMSPIRRSHRLRHKVYVERVCANLKDNSNPVENDLSFSTCTRGLLLRHIDDGKILTPKSKQQLISSNEGCSLIGTTIFIRRVFYRYTLMCVCV